MYNNMLNQTHRRLKSMALSDEELALFKAWVDGQPTIIDAAVKLDVARGTVGRVLAFKTGSPETIGKVKAVIGAMATAC
jgi:hypothetical protein